MSPVSRAVRAPSLLALAALCLSCGDRGDDETDLDDANNPNGIRLALLPAGVLEEELTTGEPTAEVFINAGLGASMGDLDGDGDLDLVLARAPDSRFGGGPTLILRNESPEGGPIAFRADDGLSAFTATKTVLATALGDYDADGDLDLYLGCLGGNLLLQNAGDGSFSDVTTAAGVAGPSTDASPGALWADLNSDGLLDLYVVHVIDPSTEELRPNALFLNLGDGTFAEVAAASGTDSTGAAQAALVADLDADGTLEIYLGNDDLSSEGIPSPRIWPSDQLYARESITDEGVPVFQDVTEARGIFPYRSSMCVSLDDYDADGDFDLYITDIGANELYLWDPTTRTYDDEAAAFGVQADSDDAGNHLISWGASALDLDRDGALELFVVHGAIFPLYLYDISDPFPYGQLDHYYRQPSPGAPFLPITESVGLPVEADLGDTTKGLMGRGAYWGDLDGDGDDDLLIGASADTFRLYENQTASTGHYLRLRLEGTVSSPDPIGALVTVETDDQSSVTAQYVRDGQPYGHGDLVLEVGLGSALPTSVHIQWPSGLAQTLDAVQADTELSIREPDWLELSARVVTASEASAALTYRAVDAQGALLGSAGAGRAVSITRTDGLTVSVVDVGDGSYTAQLPHPGESRRTRLIIEVDGAVLPVSPLLSFR